MGSQRRPSARRRGEWPPVAAHVPQEGCRRRRYRAGLRIHVAACAFSTVDDLNLASEHTVRHSKIGYPCPLWVKSGHMRCKSYVRFTPNSDRESGHRQTVMSALPPRADMCGATRDVRFGPRADIGSTSDELSRARQYNPDLGELARLCIDFDCARMLLDDDVVTDCKARAGTLSGWFGREERIEHLVFHIWRNPSAVIADADFHPITKVLVEAASTGS